MRLFSNTSSPQPVPFLSSPEIKRSFLASLLGLSLLQYLLDDLLLLNQECSYNAIPYTVAAS